MTEAPAFVSVQADVAARKAALRARLLARRRAIDADTAAAAAMAVRDHAVSALSALSGLSPPAGAVVGGYWPMRGELDPRPLLATLAAKGHPVALPVTPPANAPPLLTFRVWSGDPLALVDGPFGTRQPPDGAPVCDPDWLLVPLVGFDQRGGRLGYGGGFYDRYLAGRSGVGVTVIGFGYALQDVPLAEGGVPTGPHDIPLAVILTEAGAILPEAF